MTKPLDKLTKAELLAILTLEQETRIKRDSENAQLRADVQRLKADLVNLESRRRFEGQCYRAAIHDGTTGPRPISPKRAALEAAKREAMESGRTVAVRW